LMVKVIGLWTDVQKIPLEFFSFFALERIGVRGLDAESTCSNCPFELWATQHCEKCCENQDPLAPVFLAKVRPSVDCGILYQKEFDRWVRIMYEATKGDERMVVLLSHDSRRLRWSKLEIIDYNEDTDWKNCHIPSILC